MNTGKPIPLAVVCVGPERWHRTQVMERLKGQCLAPGFEETDFVRLQASEEIPAIREVLATAPFGSTRRLVMVEGFEELTPDSVPWLEQYLRQPNPKVCLLLCAERADQATQSWIRIEGVETVVCAVSDPRGWVARRAKELGSTIGPPAVERLLARSPKDLPSLSLALESLGLLAAPRTEITAEDVEQLFSPSVQETAFDILDRAGAGDAGKAIEALHQGLLQGRIPIEQFFGAIGWYCRMIWEARRGKPLYGGSSPLRRKALSRFAHWPEEKLRQMLEEALQVDADLKRGHPAPELAADQFLVKLAS